MTTTNEKISISIVTPCFNEEEIIITFLDELIEKIKDLPIDFNIVVVDDCSYDNTLSVLKSFVINADNINFYILHLKYNAGHQQAIFQGILFLKELKQSYAIIMDSDGEDAPDAIPLLAEQINFDIVEVKRGQRSEGVIFSTLYYFYKIIFRTVTGKRMNFGNFCMLNEKLIERIQLTSFIHLPAYLLKQKAKRTNIVYNRKKRINGKSKMGYKNLLLHSFKSFIEFGDDLLLWFLRIFVLVLILLVATSVNLLYQKFITHTAILGWFSTLSLGLLNLTILCLGFFVMGILLLNLIHHRNKDLQSIYTIIRKPNL